MVSRPASTRTPRPSSRPEGNALHTKMLVATGPATGAAPGRIALPEQGSIARDGPSTYSSRLSIGLGINSTETRQAMASIRVRAVAIPLIDKGQWEGTGGAGVRAGGLLRRDSQLG